MAKGKWSQTSKDDPLFNGRITVSSHTRRKPEGRKMVSRYRASEEEHQQFAKACGIPDEGELIISLNRKKPGKG